MSSMFTITLIFLSFKFPVLVKTRAAQGSMSPHLLDRTIRDYAIRTFSKSRSHTGVSHVVQLPANLSGITVHTAKFRCGSLRRYGANIEEFHVGIGLRLHPCVVRLVIVTQVLGHNWPFLYSSHYDLSGYQLVSPVLGLLAYNVDHADNIVEIKIAAGISPITIDFRNWTNFRSAIGGLEAICASFEDDGKVRLSKQGKQGMCSATKLGHFGLVVESPSLPPQTAVVRKKVVSRGKEAMAITIGAALGAVLIGLLLVAMFVKVKKKSMMEELERRAYEEEALQVSMVGNVHTSTAPGTWTEPATEQHQSKRKKARKHKKSRT